METNYEKSGAYVSRAFYEWLLEKNDELTDRYQTFGELFMTYSNSKYKRFIEEQSLMANNFFYRIKKCNYGIRLVRSYDMVFLPFDQPIDPKEIITSTDDFVVSYSNICQDKRYPMKYNYLNYSYLSKYLCMDNNSSFVITDERNRYEKNLGMESYENLVFINFMDYAMAEENSEGLLRFNLEYHMARRMEANVIRHLMDEAERLYLVNRRKKNYELRLFAFAEAIMKLSTDRYKVGQKIPMGVIKEQVEQRMDKLRRMENADLEIPKMCRQIREARTDIIGFKISGKYIENYEEQFEDYLWLECEEEETDEFYLEDEKRA